MKSTFEGWLKLKLKSINKKNLSPAAVIFYPDFPKKTKEQEYLEHKKRIEKAITEAFRATTPTLPRIPLAHIVCPSVLMERETCESIMFKWLFCKCRDFRG